MLVMHQALAKRGYIEKTLNPSLLLKCTIHVNENKQGCNGPSLNFSQPVCSKIQGYLCGY